MGLTDAKKLFDELRAKGSINVAAHAVNAHPERGFSPMEIRGLAQGSGVLRDNKAATAKAGSFVWHCKDAMNRRCELAITFEVNEAGQLILVISAWRHV